MFQSIEEFIEDIDLTWLPPYVEMARQWLVPENIAFVVFAFVWIVAMLRERAYLRVVRLARSSEQAALGEGQEQRELTPVSVVLLASNQCDLLRQRLPLFLEQDHPQFEVIVVDMGSDDDTRDYLEALATMPNLRVRHLPPGAKQVSEQTLALTMGIRTASHPWVVLTDISCQPASASWLSHLSRYFTEGTDMVFGHTRYHDPHGWAGLRCYFFRTWQESLCLGHARRHYLYRCPATNLALRKDFFLASNGFASSTSLRRGQTDIFVNAHSTPRNTRFCLSPSSAMLEDCPPDERSWKLGRLFFMETRRHLPRRCSYRTVYFLSVLLTWLYTLCLLATLALILLLAEPPYYMGIATLLLWVIHTQWRGHCINAAFRALGEARLFFSLPFMLHLVPKWDFRSWLRWRVADKRIFFTPFV